MQKTRRERSPTKCAASEPRASTHPEAAVRRATVPSRSARQPLSHRFDLELKASRARPWLHRPQSWRVRGRETNSSPFPIRPARQPPRRRCRDRAAKPNRPSFRTPAAGTGKTVPAAVLTARTGPCPSRTSFRCRHRHRICVRNRACRCSRCGTPPGSPAQYGSPHPL
jgi:hypothetical protein